MAVELGLQVNYNSEVQRMIEAEDGTFTLTTRDGRVRPSLHTFQSLKAKLKAFVTAKIAYQML